MSTSATTSYHPVLLANAHNVSDDSAVSTLPRSQVDYLSHDWEEEDVWKSWRNMTRQKNEIANGMRLENASWRTWWKQRNKLKTISPETLNWLKDSDVTWLYGPLHTAAEWTPPPRKSTVVPNDHLDLSQPKHKPILKHRNLSEFLTSDLPNSPAWGSPAGSESEGDMDEEDEYGEGDENAEIPDRPSLSYSKSDTHVIPQVRRTKPIRKHSPPGAEVPTVTALKPSHAYSGTDLKGYFNSHLNHVAAAAADPNSSSSSTPSPPGTDSTPTHSHSHARKRSKHITFNTYVEQCIAIDKPTSKPSPAPAPTAQPPSTAGWDGRTGTKGVNWDVNYQDIDDEEIEELGDERGYDEDVESADEEGDWKQSAGGDNEFAIDTESEESDVDGGSSSCPPSNDSDEEDGVVEMRPSKRRPSLPSRSTSKSSSSSQSDSGSKRRSYSNARRRRSSGSTLRPGFSSSSNSSSASLPPLPTPAVSTIASIPPTMLKVGGTDSWDGFGVHAGPRTPWLDSFGDDDWSDDGYGAYDSAGVDLVYVPRTTQPIEKDEGAEKRSAFFALGDSDMDMDLGYGQDYFGGVRSQREPKPSNTQPEQLVGGGQEERVEDVAQPPSKAKPSIVREPSPPPASNPVNIPKRSISPPQQASAPSPSPSSSLLTPHLRGRTADGNDSSPRGRSLTRTPSWTSDSERSRSMGGSTSPMGSLSPDGSGSIGAAAGSVYANGRSEKDSDRRRRRERRVDNAGNVTVNGNSRSLEDQLLAESYGLTEEPKEELPLGFGGPTPSNSPEQSFSVLKAAMAHKSVDPPTQVTPKAAAPTTPQSEPVTPTPESAFPSSQPKAAPVAPSSTTHNLLRSTSPRREPSETVMGRMVTTAGSFFGLWN
ncbi:hypothetical protein CYLTODRAFT_451584 [Cylindrobasidium torrendii FP15055 ss-10]|uniref:Nitrogen regulatory protein areA GATA-like domain-containing protein n=1 Tax=Cylindrobasidium torrendii FP15055 ss-10 TaxID=1314674 RepID=A0A0D7BJ95_9AGAR|nr:hypothetical protein CYLTODRAFT_451584 [Cylindrobasidium torrendii FP15055 ss-10]